VPTYIDPAYSLQALPLASTVPPEKGCASLAGPPAPIDPVTVLDVSRFTGS
jgi:hypothetical protein